MKIICNKNDLVNGVSIVSKAVSNKTTLPILECILVEASAGTIQLTANDMELGIETTIDGDIVEQGKIALDAKLFFEIVRKLPDNNVIIETDKDYKATITCEKACFHIMGQEGKEFPYLPEIEKDKSVVLSQYSLKEIVRQTIFSISDNENNKLMTGELFEVNENKLNVVSLDGHRISIRNIELKESYDSFKVVVPGKTLQEITKIISGEADKDVIIYVTSKHILFEFDQTRVVSRLLEGEYYKISQMLSSDYETKITINKREFLDCIDRASLLIRESDKKPIVINITENSLELNINSFYGSMEENVMIKKEGKDLLIGFNPKFLMDVLRVIDDEEINIYLVNPKAPCFIKDEKESYIYLILPVNFNH
ncbi:MAG: DNA polymerase III subunit beta [Anaerostipes sp.]|jgi:DNA polymerase-3 subunit beta|nr:DNA polymerase III subunit beta [Anaerostipes sp.]MDD3747475.1 DNA polymerase III subunit beta [Anaerostipes sp.]MDD4371609.1 DNA polymerase III subunit beta [Anaerostipes sp.]